MRRCLSSASSFSTTLALLRVRARTGARFGVSRRPAGKARRGKTPAVFDREATPPNGMHRRPTNGHLFLRGPFVGAAPRTPRGRYVGTPTPHSAALLPSRSLAGAPRPAPLLRGARSFLSRGSAGLCPTPRPEPRLDRSWGPEAPLRSLTGAASATLVAQVFRPASTARALPGTSTPRV